MDLITLGWTEFFARQIAVDDELEPARITAQERHHYLIRGGGPERLARASGRLAAACREQGDWPVIGDWVQICRVPADPHATIDRLLARRTRIARTVAGAGSEAQALAANVDVVFIVESLAEAPNLRRIERQLAGVWESGAEAIVVLNKADRCDDLDGAAGRVRGVAFGCSVLVVSAATGEGVGALRDAIGEQRTAVFLGPSGVGKSSLSNRLLGRELLATTPVRESDQKGRHTTTSRRLLLVPGGGLLIDTPGLREFELFEGSTGGFTDIELLAARCRFRDCGHQGEPECAIAAALESGELERSRWESYEKLQRELQRVAARRSERGRREEKQRVKRTMRRYKEIMRQKRERGRD